jgi:hypothetical protein
MDDETTMQRLIHFPVYSKRDRKYVRNEVRIKGLGQEREGGRCTEPCSPTLHLS